MEFAQWWWLAAALAAVGLLIKAAHWAGTISEHKSQVTALLEEVRTDIKKILGRLPVDTVASSSPLTLTDTGREVSEVLRVVDWARHQAKYLQSEIAGMSDYEVQQFCFDFITTRYEPAMKQNRAINDVAYAQGLTREQVLKVFALELRDTLLERIGSSQDRHKGAGPTNLPMG